MDITISKRALTDGEIELLIEEIRKFPNPVIGNKKQLKLLEHVYVAKVNTQFAGICAVIKLNSWTKLGPFVVLQKYHGKGIGKTIIGRIVNDYSGDNLFVGSRNPAVWKIATNLGFKEIRGYWNLPNEIKLYLVGYIVKSLSIDFIKELIRKKPAQEGKYRGFAKTLYL